MPLLHHAWGRGMGRYGGSSQTPEPCHPEAQAHRMPVAHPSRAEGSSRGHVQGRAPQRSPVRGPRPSSRRLKPQLESHEVRLRGLLAESSAPSQPKRGSGLPLPCAAGDGGGGSQGVSGSPSNLVRRSPLSRAVCGGEAGRGGTRGMRGTPSNPDRSSTLSARSSCGEGPGVGPPAACEAARRTPIEVPRRRPSPCAARRRHAPSSPARTPSRPRATSPPASLDRSP